MADSDPLIFDQASGKRIANAVRIVEGLPTDLTGVSGRRSSVVEIFPARITGSTQDGANKRWKYDWEEIVKTAAGYGGWSTLVGGRSGAANLYNLIEDINAATGQYGNGANSADFPGGGTFAIQPIPIGVKVMVLVVGIDGVGVEFWCECANGLRGTCS